MSSSSGSAKNSDFPSLAPFVPPTQPTESLVCKLCSATFANESRFHNHLTDVHFRDKIKKRIKHPFVCLVCSYAPSSNLKYHEKEEQLLMHYGIDERIAIKYYEDAVANLPLANPQVPKDSGSSSIVCCLCSQVMENKRSFLNHVTLRHFSKQICKQLPQNAPFRCPFRDCKQSKLNPYSLILHYGVEHGKSMEMYEKCQKSRSDSSSSIKDLKSGPVRQSSQPLPVKPKLQAVVNPYHPEADDGAKNTGADPVAGSSSVNVVGTARAKMMRHWQSSSIEGQNAKIDELEQRIKSLENVHKEELQDKVSYYERHISAKQSKLDEKSDEIARLKHLLKLKDKALEKSTEQSKHLADKSVKLEKELSETKGTIEKLSAFKDEANREIAMKEEERLNSYESLYQEEKRREELEQRLSNISSVLHKESRRLGSIISHLSVSFDCNPTVGENTASTLEDQPLRIKISKNKQSIESVSEVSEDESGSDKTGQFLSNLVSKLSNVSEEIAVVHENNTKEVSELRNKLNDNENLHHVLRTNLDQVKAIEKEKKDLLKEIKTLKKTLSEWEIRQFTNVKLIAGLEKERDSLQLKLKEQQDGKLSHEDQLYWKDFAIRNLEKDIQSLNAKFKENEKGQESVISEYKDKLENSKKKILELENDLAQSAKNNQTMRAQLELKERALETQKAMMNTQALDAEAVQTKLKAYDQMESEVANRANEISHLKVCLNQKNQELKNLQDTAVCQKAEIDRCLKENGVLTFSKKKLLEEFKKVKSEMSSLEKKIHLKNTEIKILKKKVKNLKENLVKAEETSPVDAENEIEQSLMDQVLSDMDQVIKSKELHNDEEPPIKVEPVDIEEDVLILQNENIEEHFTPLSSSPQQMSMHNLNSNEEIVLNINHAEILDSEIQAPEISGMYTQDLGEELADNSFQPKIVETVAIAPWPSFVPIGSHPELIRKRKKRGLSTENGSPEKRPKSSLKDVTHEYGSEEDEQVLCGVCESWDPPEDKTTHHKPVTEWVGCDCERWFHKSCTKLKRFTNKFTCRSLKMECLKAPTTMQSTATSPS